MNTYTPEVATVMANIIELKVSTLMLEMKNKSFCMSESILVMDSIGKLNHMAKELRQNDVTLKVDATEYMQHATSLYNDVVDVLLIHGVVVTDTTSVSASAPVTTTTTIVPNTEAAFAAIDAVVDAEELGVTSVVLSDTDADTTLTHEDRAKVAAIMEEAHRQAAIRLGDIMTGTNTTVDDIEVCPATAQWLNNNATVVPEVETPDSGKKGSKRRQAV